MKGRIVCTYYCSWSPYAEEPQVAVDRDEEILAGATVVGRSWVRSGGGVEAWLAIRFPSAKAASAYVKLQREADMGWGCNPDVAQLTRVATVREAHDILSDWSMTAFLRIGT